MCTMPVSAVLFSVIKVSSGIMNMSRALCTVPIGAGSNQLLTTLPAVLILQIVSVVAASGITLLSWFLLTAV